MRLSRQMNQQNLDGKPIFKNWLIPTLLALSGLFFMTHASHAQTQPSGCGSLENGYGPLDYRTEPKRLQLVESAHFTSNVENLIKGNSGALGKELDYTLRAIPNHHRALVSVMNFGEKTRSPKPYGLSYDIECYFERALRFRPDDNTARMLYATFLVRNNRSAEATGQLETATAQAGDNAFTHYNIGRIYFDMKNHERALTQAHKAYALGFGLPILRDQLIAKGAWKDPQVQPSEASNH